MQRDDETTVSEISGIRVSISKTTKRSAPVRMDKAWNSVLSAHSWTQLYKTSGMGYAELGEDVKWSDEASVQVETHCRFHCYKRGQKPRYKLRPKHPLKVHMWAGISCCGPTGVCIFDGIMDATMYTRILDQYLVPFIRDVRISKTMTLNTLPAMLFYGKVDQLVENSTTESRYKSYREFVARVEDGE